VDSDFATPLKEAMTKGAHSKQIVDSINASLARHKALEEELKVVKDQIKSTENKRDELVESARKKISVVEALNIIIERLRTVLLATYQDYLNADLRACIKAVENLWEKYAVTAKEIEAERDKASQMLKNFLVELGYE